MTDREDLDKLFDAALHERKAPSRFGIPEGQQKAAPSPFQKSEKVEDVTASPFQASHSEAKPFVPASTNVFQAAPPKESVAPEVILDQQGVASLDHTLNAELEEILDKKIAAEKRKRRRGRLMFFGLLIGGVVGVSGWVVNNPEKMESAKKILSEIRSAADPNAVADKYNKSLEKVAARGDQLSDATSMIDGKAGKDGDAEDQGFDKEMKQIAGEDAGLSSSERQKILKEKFDSVKKKN